jgi:hypothetical protein
MNGVPKMMGGTRLRQSELWALRLLRLFNRPA